MSIFTTGAAAYIWKLTGDVIDAVIGTPVYIRAPTGVVIVAETSTAFYVGTSVRSAIVLHRDRIASPIS